MKIRPYVLKETNWKHVRKRNFQIALLPWGATEAHNYHLPYGTDSYLGEEVAIESARKAWDQGTESIVLPCVPRSEEHTSELQSRENLVCRLLLEKKKK